MNLIELMERAANERPRKLFLRHGKKKLTFGEFHSAVRKISAGLKDLGIKQGDKVALILNNSIEFVTAYFAAIYAGATVVPLNTFLRLEEIVYILNDSKSKALITSSDFNPVLKDLSLSRTPGLEAVVAVDEVQVAGHVKYSSLISENEYPPAEVKDDDAAVVIYTSGTTGHPKGAMLTHRNLTANIHSISLAIKIHRKDRFIIFLPMFHAFSFTVCILLPLYMVCSVVVIKSIQPFSRILIAMLMNRITVFVAIPQVYNVLASKKLPFFFTMKLFNPTRVYVSGAAPLAGEVLKKFEAKLRTPLIEGYGLSEASPVVSVNPLDGVRKAGSVGPPIPGVTVEIVDEAGNRLQTGEAGEIIVRGDNVMKGYYNREEETREMIRDGWLYTGDIGRKDGDGYIYIMDRKKDLILVNGMNLYPREVEEVLYTHPAVQDAAVIGIKDEAHGEIPIGILKLKEGFSAGESELKKFCRQHLANFKIPHRFEFWEELPRTGTGKVLKREIKRAVNEKNAKT